LFYTVITNQTILRFHGLCLGYIKLQNLMVN